MGGSEGDVNDVLTVTRRFSLSMQSEDKRVRKEAFKTFQSALSDAERYDPSDYHDVFKESHIYVFNGLRDNSEQVRSQTIAFLQFFLVDTLPVNDYYLSYLFPVILERLSSCEIVEESEEIRFQLNVLLHSIIQKYSGADQLKPFLGDFVQIYKETVKDKYPMIKESSCRAIIALSSALPRYFHMHAENLTAPVLTAFTHQRYKIRVVAIQCIGDIVMHSPYKALEDSIGPMAERLFDQIAVVRRTVIQVASRWLLEYRDRYSFFHKLLPLILTGLNDEVDETREEAHVLWKRVGEQYERENESDLKDQMDFLTTMPKYYPENLSRPGLGARTLVQRNVSKIAPAVARELSSWQADVRVRCSQLLCALTLHAEEVITQHLQDILTAMYFAAKDEDHRVVENVIQASKILGCFVPVKTWLKLIIPAIEDGVHFGHLSVLSGLINGSPAEYVSSHLDSISEVLVDTSVCQTRKKKLQLGLVCCVDAISAKYSDQCQTTGSCLFEIIVTVISLRDPENVEIDFKLIENLKTTLKKDIIWSDYLPDLLGKIYKCDPKAWMVVTPERCIFEIILLNSGEAFGKSLIQIGDILKETLHNDCDPESRLKTFVALSMILEKKDVIFADINNDNDLATFLKTLIIEIIIPTLVWKAGRVAEALRTVAACALHSTLTPGTIIKFAIDKRVFRPLFDRLVPLLISMLEDPAYRTREKTLCNICMLKEIATQVDCWGYEDLIKFYPEMLKRFDDPNRTVQFQAIKSVKRILVQTPSEFRTSHYKAHHELLIDTLMTHFDDIESGYCNDILDILKVLPNVCDPDFLREKVNRHKPMLRNKEGCEEVLNYLQKMALTQ